MIFFGEMFAQAIEQIKGDVFRRRIPILKKRQVVQVMVIELRKNLPCDLLYFAEIDQNAAVIETMSANGDLNFPVMAVKIFTLSTEIPELMGSGKISDDFDFIQGLFQNSLSCPSLLLYRE